MKLKIRFIFTAITLMAFLLSCSNVHRNSYPNIVLILADDTGADVCDAYGGTSYNTPNIVALSKTGLTFNHCYIASVCSPSRVNLLTGRSVFITGQTWGTIPENEITFAHQLKKGGYQTAIGNVEG